MATMVLQRRILRGSILVMLGLLTFMMIVLNRGAYAEQADPINVALVPPKTARTGEPILVQLVATNAHNLAGFQATVRFDAAHLRLTGASTGKGLRGASREVLQLGPLLLEDAAVLGAATCPAADCKDARGKQAPSAWSGANGHIELGVVDLYTTTPGQYTLSLEGVQLVDPQGNQLAVTTSNVTIDVVTN